jgi:arylformamidase
VSDLIDLSQPLRSGMLVGGDLDPPTFQRRRTGHSRPGLEILVTEYRTASHVGTHVDAPKHFDAAGLSIDELSLDSFAGSAVISVVASEPGELISMADIVNGGPGIRPGDIVVIKTGWGRHYATDERAYRLHPYLDGGTAEQLLEAGIKMLATDTMSPDAPHDRREPGFAFPVHRTLLSAGVLIAENLDLGRVESGRYELFGFPLAIAGGDGAPARFVARRTA